MAIKAAKGFDRELRCKGMQYEVGKTYEHTGKVACCSSGFHSCENPLHVLQYYSAANSRFCDVEVDGEIDRHNQDSKIASSKITIGAEISLKSLIEAGFKFIFEKIKWGEKDTPQTHGNSSAAQTHGYYSAAQTHGDESIAVSTGIHGKASGALGNWLVLAEWKQNKDSMWYIKTVKSAEVDGVKIKANTWYVLKNGKFVSQGPSLGQDNGPKK